MKSYQGKTFYTQNDRKKYYDNYRQSKAYEKESMINKLLEDEVKGVKHPASLLLDSSLITPTQNKPYTIKIIQCGEYYQIYYFNNLKIKKEEGREIETKKIDGDYLFKENNYNSKSDSKVIEYKNIMRSKFKLQRLVKANEDIFKTFITLTFEDNICDIKTANEKFDIWRTKIKSIKKDFQYVCVPEFQKRGAVHYHLLTNLDIDKSYQYTRRNKLLKVKLIIPQAGSKTKYDVKYWSYGFTSVYPMKDVNVVGYITKYMTKDIDNRLFGHRRYLFSSTLVKPIENYVNLEHDSDFTFLADILSNSNELFSGSYKDITGERIEFVERKLKPATS